MKTGIGLRAPYTLKQSLRLEQKTASEGGGVSEINVYGASAINQNDTIACFLLQF